MALHWAGLGGQYLALVRTRRKPPVFDAPQVTDLVDLLPQPDRRDLESLSFGIRDNARRAVAAHYALTGPAPSAGELADGTRKAVHDLEKRTEVTVTFTAIQLPVLERHSKDIDDRSSGPDGGTAGDRSSNNGWSDAGQTPAGGPTAVMLKTDSGTVESVDSHPELVSAAIQSDAAALSLRGVVLSSTLREPRKDGKNP